MRRLRSKGKPIVRIADFLDAEVGDVGHRDAVLPGGLQIHHVHADAVPGDDLATGDGLDHGAVDGGPLHDQRVGVCDVRDQLLRHSGL